MLINCTAIAWPVATMMWIKDGTPIHATRNVTLNKKTTVSSVEIVNTTLSDAGNWTCISENMFGRELVHQRIEIICKYTLFYTKYIK